MKKIYVAHSKKMDYLNLYKVVRGMKGLEDYSVLLPHEESSASSNPREFYKTLDLFIADVTCAGTGLGIELGWVYDDGVPIYYLYEEGSKLSSSIKCVSDKFYSYKDNESLETAILEIVEDWKKNNDSKEV